MVEPRLGLLQLPGFFWGSDWVTGPPHCSWAEALVAWPPSGLCVQSGRQTCEQKPPKASLRMPQVLPRPGLEGGPLV